MSPLIEALRAVPPASISVPVMALEARCFTERANSEANASPPPGSDLSTECTGAGRRAEGHQVVKRGEQLWHTGPSRNS